MKTFFRFLAFAAGFCILFAVLGWIFIGIAFSLEGSSPEPITIGLFSIVGFILVFPVGAFIIFLSDGSPIASNDNLIGAIALISNGLFWAAAIVLTRRFFKRRKRSKEKTEQD